MKARRPLLWPLVPAYAAGLRAKEALRGAGLLPTRTLRWPVLSVGSLSAGGAGKTPVVMAVAALLAEHGWGVDVLSRGYGREGSGIARVDPNAEDAAARFGDEPVLIARRTGLPVWVGSNRWAAGEAAEREALAGESALRVPRETDEEGDRSERRVHLLDDGFQHRKLQRAFDLVLVTEADLGDVLLPAGNLREPLPALTRAGAVVLRESEQDALLRPVREWTGDGTPLWTIRRTLEFPAPLGVFGAGLRPLAFCAIARPDEFVASLRQAGCGVVDAVVFRDHARYGEREIEQILRFARELKATGLVTTEKDAVKLSAGTLARLEREVGAVVVVGLRAEFVYTSPVLRTLEWHLHRALRRRGTGIAAGSTRPPGAEAAPRPVRDADRGPQPDPERRA